MQTIVPELTDLSKEPKDVLDLYGPDVQQPGTFAYNCLLARRLAERGVRFIQLFLRGWDHHGSLPGSIRADGPDADQPSRGPDQGPEAARHARRHAGRLGRRVRPHGLQPGHADARTTTAATIIRAASRMWLAGGGIKRRPWSTARPTTSATTSPTDPVHVHDLNATILHCLGIDHEKLTYRFQGRDFRLTDVHGNVVERSAGVKTSRRLTQIHADQNRKAGGPAKWWDNWPNFFVFTCVYPR